MEGRAKNTVIGARIGSTACVIADGVDGLLVKPEAPDDLAGAIRALLSDPARRTQMGERGYLKTVSEFTWERVAEKFGRACLGIVAGKRATA